MASDRRVKRRHDPGFIGEFRELDFAAAGPSILLLAIAPKIDARFLGRRSMARFRHMSPSLM
jgi:hypothetical protein